MAYETVDDHSCLGSETTLNVDKRSAWRARCIRLANTNKGEIMTIMNSEVDLPRIPLTVIVALLLTSVTAPETLAQSSTSAILEEVIVTARKREEGLQAVPLSVTAFGSSQSAPLRRRTDAPALPQLKLPHPSPSTSCDGVDRRVCITLLIACSPNYRQFSWHHLKSS
jgi:hypothetical protein